LNPVSFTFCNTIADALNDDVLMASENRSVAWPVNMFKSNEVNTGDVESTTNWSTCFAFTLFTIAVTATPLMSTRVLVDIVRNELLCVAPTVLSFIEFRSASDNPIDTSRVGEDDTAALVVS
jgi:hypothetical protein